MGLVVILLGASSSGRTLVFKTNGVGSIPAALVYLLGVWPSG